MSGMGRRSWLENMGMLFVAGGLPRTSMTSTPVVPESAGKPLQLADFQPRSMLHIPETKVPRSHGIVLRLMQAFGVNFFRCNRTKAPNGNRGFTDTSTVRWSCSRRLPSCR